MASRHRATEPQREGAANDKLFPLCCNNLCPSSCSPTRKPPLLLALVRKMHATIQLRGPLLCRWPVSRDSLPFCLCNTCRSLQLANSQLKQLGSSAWPANWAQFINETHTQTEIHWRAGKINDLLKGALPSGLKWLQQRRVVW